MTFSTLEFYDSQLECPKCKKKVEEKGFVKEACDCGFKLRINFNYDRLRDIVTKKSLKKRVFNHDRYFEFYPLRNPENLIQLGTGGTPLIRAGKLAERLGVKSLYLKIEIGNPSGSFKDRPISIGVSKAKEHIAHTLTAASSGNAAAALATFGARADMEVVVFVPEHTPKGKIGQLLFLGAKVIRVSVVKEGEDPTVALFKLAYKSYGWTPSPSFGPFNPFQFEGTKSLGFEISEQLGWESPDWILCNTGSGGLLAGTFKGFSEFLELDFINDVPRMVAIQPQECAPIVQGVINKTPPLEFTDWPKTPNTVAGGLADPHPWDADSALEAIDKSKGTGVMVNEEDILQTQKWLATDEGIFGEPSGTAALAGLDYLLKDGTIDPSDTIVIPITGTGLKDPEVFRSIKMIRTIKPRLEDLQQLLTQ
ncbi:MAG: threonine synthase [Candidatus Hodarchaeales archaeon]|jgi:threonine synthase